jgi:hypothetical protein
MSRLSTRRSSVEAPTNTFIIDTSEAQLFATGLDGVRIVVNTDGSFSTDILFTFLFPEPAADFVNDTEYVLFCDDYKVLTSTLPAAVGDEISDTIFFGDAKQFDEFVRQLKSDFSVEVKLK